MGYIDTWWLSLLFIEISDIQVEDGSIPVYEMYDRKYNDMTFGGHVKLKLQVFKILPKKF